MAIEDIAVAAPARAPQSNGVRNKGGQFAPVFERASTPHTYIHSGCYRARDSLTQADRVAYGLRGKASATPGNLPVVPFQAQRPMKNKPPFRRPAAGASPHRLETAASAGLSSGRRFRIICPCRVIRLASRERTSAAAFPPPLSPKWYGLDVRVSGTVLRCLVFRGRTFVSSHSHSSNARRDKE